MGGAPGLARCVFSGAAGHGQLFSVSAGPTGQSDWCSLDSTHPPSFHFPFPSPLERVCFSGNYRFNAVLPPD